MNKQAQKLTCSNCHSRFIPDESYIDSEKLLCTDCQKIESQKRGSGRDEGQSHLSYGPCENCGSQTQYFPGLHKGDHIICPDCEKRNSSSSY